MNAKSRRQIEMGKRVLEFARQHPDQSPAFATAVTRLQDRLVRAGQLAEQQRIGLNTVHVATRRKADLRKQMRLAHLDHLAQVAVTAAVEDPELPQRFTYPADATTYLAFQTVAAGLAAEAESRKELLIKYGLSEDVLSDLKVMLDQFQVVVEQGAAGRLTHVGASAELISVAEEVAQVVKIMNGLIRIRFAKQEDVLAAWESASNVFGPIRPETKPDSETTPPSDGSTPSEGTTPSTGTPSSGNVHPAA
jgi:hypothetical protein